MAASGISRARVTKDVADVISYEGPEFVAFADEHDMHTVKVAIFGPSDTPYEGGVFFFTITLDSSYPFQHPSVKHDIVSTKMRIHPNMYSEGKVCLSVLGTWGSTDTWSPLMTLIQLVLTIQSLLDENPITNEPGYDKTDPVDSRQYTDAIAHEVIRCSIRYNKCVPPGYTPATERVRKYIQSKQSVLFAKCLQYSEMYPPRVAIPSEPRHQLHGVLTPDFSLLKEEVEKLLEPDADEAVCECSI